MEILDTFLMPSAWIALLTLTFLEIVLGVDNVVFLSIMTSRLPDKKQPKARVIGLICAMFFRILLLFSIAWLMQLTKPIFSFDVDFVEGAISGQSLIIFAGGLFLLYKSVSEIHRKLDGEDEKQSGVVKSGMVAVIVQIVALDIVFSFDSVLTAVGLVSFTEFGYVGAMAIMVSAVIISVMIMLLFAEAISRFVNNYPTIQMLGLAFLLLIGVMLLLEAAHLSKITLFDTVVSDIPKGYIYFAIAFSFFVELVNIRIRKHSKTIQSKDSNEMDDTENNK